METKNPDQKPKSKNKTFDVNQAPDNSNIPLEENGLWNSLFISYVNKLVNCGEKFPFQYSMLFGVREDIQYERDAEGFDKFMQNALVNKESFTLFETYHYIKRFMYKASFLMFLSNMLQIGFPLILKQFIRWLLDEDDTSNWGYFWILILCVVMIFKIVLMRAGVVEMHKSRNTLGNRFAVRFFLLKRQDNLAKKYNRKSNS